MSPIKSKNALVSLELSSSFYNNEIFNISFLFFLKPISIISSMLPCSSLKPLEKKRALFLFL